MCAICGEWPATDSKLIPDLSTEVGKEVVKWRKLLHAVPVVMITYGLYCNPELSTSGLKIPKCLFRSKEGRKSFFFSKMIYSVGVYVYHIDRINITLYFTQKGIWHEIPFYTNKLLHICK